MSKILVNEIVNKDDNGPVMVPEGICLPSTGGNSTTLDYYEEFIHPMTVKKATAGNTQDVDATLRIVRIGNVVTIRFPSMLPTTGAGSIAPTPQSTLIPARFTPASTQVFIIRTRSGGAFDHGYLELGSTGGFEIRPGISGSDNFPSGTADGLVSPVTITFNRL